MFLLFLPFFGHGRLGYEGVVTLGGASKTLAQKGTRVSTLTRFRRSAEKTLAKKGMQAQKKIDDLGIFLRARKGKISKQELLQNDLVAAEAKLDELAKELKALQKIRDQRKNFPSLTTEQSGVAEQLEAVTDKRLYGMTLDQKIDSLQKKLLRAEKDFKKAQARLSSDQMYREEKDFEALLAQKEVLQKELSQHERTLQNKEFSAHVKEATKTSKEKIQREFDDLVVKIREIQNHEAEVFESELPKVLGLENTTRSDIARELLKPIEKKLATKEGKRFLQTEIGRKWLINTEVGRSARNYIPFMQKWIKSSPDGIRFRLVNQSKGLLDELFLPIKIGKDSYDSMHAYLNNFFIFQINKFRDLEELFKQADAQKIFYKTDEFLMPNEKEQIRLAETIFDYQKKISKTRAIALKGSLFPQRDLIEGFLISDIGKQLLKTKQGKEWLHTSAGQTWLGTETGKKWLQTAEGKNYLESLTKELEEIGKSVAS